MDEQTALETFREWWFRQPEPTPPAPYGISQEAYIAGFMAGARRAEPRTERDLIAGWEAREEAVRRALEEMRTHVLSHHGSRAAELRDRVMTVLYDQWAALYDAKKLP